MKVLMIKNEYYAARVEIKQTLRNMGLFGKNYPKNLEQIPVHMRHMFEMVEPDMYL